MACTVIYNGGETWERQDFNNSFRGDGVQEIFLFYICLKFSVLALLSKMLSNLLKNVFNLPLCFLKCLVISEEPIHRIIK